MSTLDDFFCFNSDSHKHPVCDICGETDRSKLIGNPATMDAGTGTYGLYVCKDCAQRILDEAKAEAEEAAAKAPKYTYNEGRICEECTEPIPDQLEFCPECWL